MRVCGYRHRICGGGLFRFGKHDFLRGAGALVFWGICVALLVLTALLGTVGLGAKRWLIIGPVSIQISEFAKIAFVLLAARIAEDYRNGAIDMQEVFRQAAIFIIIPLVVFVYHAIRPRYYAYLLCGPFHGFGTIGPAEQGNNWFVSAWCRDGLDFYFGFKLSLRSTF